MGFISVNALLYSEKLVIITFECSVKNFVLINIVISIESVWHAHRHYSPIYISTFFRWWCSTFHSDSMFTRRERAYNNETHTHTHMPTSKHASFREHQVPWTFHFAFQSQPGAIMLGKQQFIWVPNFIRLHVYVREYDFFSFSSIWFFRVRQLVQSLFTLWQIKKWKHQKEEEKTISSAFVSFIQE